MASIIQIGTKQWRAQIRRKSQLLGNVNATKTFKTRVEADIWAREKESRIDSGVYLDSQEAQQTKFEDICLRYKQDFLPKLKGRAADASRLKTLISELGQYPVMAITSVVLSDFRKRRLEILKPQSVIHELGLINRIFKACVMDWGLYLPAGIPPVRKPSAPAGRNRRVTNEEIEAICKAAKGSLNLSSIVHIALETAMRRSEISSLQIDQINFELNKIELTNTKNGGDRDVPLSPNAKKILKGLSSKNTETVFEMKPDSITQAFDRAVRTAHATYLQVCKEQGLKVDKKFLTGIHFHDLRHEATSRLALVFPNILDLASITGHKDIQMLKRYYHPKAEDLAERFKLMKAI